MIVQRRPSVVVETGFDTGRSASAILEAMDVNGIGTLYSVEAFAAQIISHPRLQFKSGLSCEILPAIFMESGPWDFFLHDSDHEAWCQTYEYELALSFTKTGGVIATDDAEWGNHLAWQKFINRNNLPEPQPCGCLRWFEKPSTARLIGSGSSWVEGEHLAACKYADAVIQQGPIHSTARPYPPE